MEQNIASHALQLVEYTGFGKDTLKSARLGPDSFVQMALQLTFWRDQGRVCSTYETGTTRKFVHGRTETIRSLTNEARDFCRAMDPEEGVSSEQRLELLRAPLI